MKNAQNGEILARKAPSATVKNIAKSILDIFNSNVNIKTIGIREGEKMHETLITREELMRAEDLGDFYRIKYLMQPDYDEYYIRGKANQIPEKGYTSENTERLNFNLSPIL